MSLARVRPPSSALEAALRLADRLHEPPNLLRVLTYHRVDHPDARPYLNPGLISAEPETFAAQMALLADRYHVVSIQEVLRAFREGVPLPPRSVLITFDDAYRDFAEHAWPVLRRCGLPALLFVPTLYPGNPVASFWGDRLYCAVMQTDRAQVHSGGRTLILDTAASRRSAYYSLKSRLKALPHKDLRRELDDLWETLRPPPMPPSVLNWDELRALAGEGLDLGAHTRTHLLMSRVEAPVAMAEAAGSLADLRDAVGDVPPVFAYPSGCFTAKVAAGLPVCGFQLAFTTTPGLNSVAGADPMRIRRLNVGRRTSRAVLQARMVGCGAGLNRLWPHPA